jgi:hypothetical protein
MEAMRLVTTLLLLALAQPAAAADCQALDEEALRAIKPLMVMRNRQAADQFTPDGRWRGESPVSAEVERRLYSILADRSPSGDQALVYLLTVYMGEHPGEELVCEAANRGKRLIPLIRSYSKCQPLVGAEPLHKFVQGSGVLPVDAIQAIESGSRCSWDEP